MMRPYIHLQVVLSITVCIGLAPAFAEGGAQDAAREFNLKGIAMQGKGKLAEAADEYRKAIRVFPSGAGAHNNLAVVLKELNQLEPAEKEAFIAIKLRPTRADYHYNLGLIRQRQEKWAESDTSYREAIRIDPMDAEFHYYRSQVLLKLNKAADAESEIKVSLLLKSSESRYHKALADCLLQQSNNELALLEYKSALESNPQSPESGDIRSKIDYLTSVLKGR